VADAVGAAPDAEVLTPGAEEGVVADASGSSATSTIVATRAEEEAEVRASSSSARSAILVTPGAEEGVEAGSAIIFTGGAEERVEADASGSDAASTIVSTPGAEEVHAFGTGAVWALVATTGAEPGALGTSVMSGDGVVLDEAAEAALVSVGVEATVSVANVDDVGYAALSRPDSSDGETCWDTPEFRLAPPLPLPVGGAVPSRGQSSSERTRTQAGLPLPRPA